MQSIDFVLGAVGLLLGTVAALFPWHVYLYPDSYGPPKMAFSRDGQIPADEIVSTSSRGKPIFDFETGKFISTDVAATAVDTLTTGTVAPGSGNASGGDQPFPGNGRAFTVYAIDGGRALVGDVDGVYLIVRDSRLPDGTRLKTVGQDNRGRHIVTSDGRKIYLR